MVNKNRHEWDSPQHIRIKTAGLCNRRKENQLTSYLSGVLTLEGSKEYTFGSGVRVGGGADQDEVGGKTMTKSKIRQKEAYCRSVYCASLIAVLPDVGLAE